MSASVPALRVKRVYDAPAKADGIRVLVDRIWPRGLSKERAAVDLWLKEIAPSAELRTWFDHIPDRWDEFRTRYADELRANPETLAKLQDVMATAPVTLLFGAHDLQRNNAVALLEYVDRTVLANHSRSPAKPNREKRDDQ